MIHKLRQKDLQGYMAVSDVGRIAKCSSKSVFPLIKSGIDQVLTL